MAIPVLGLPAMAVPTGVSGGLPVGVQIHADRWHDIHCLDAGSAIESVVGTLTPPNSTITRSSTDRCIASVSGEMLPLENANSPPATPAKTR